MLGDEEERGKGAGRTGKYQDIDSDDDHVSGYCADCGYASGFEYDVRNVTGLDKSAVEKAFL